jgi:hypothetical protein
MDFQDDHTAFGSTAPDEVGQMYVPGADDHGIGEDTGNGPDGRGTDGQDSDSQHRDRHGAGPHGTVSVAVGGREVTASATLDVDHDGRADTAVVTDSAGDHIAITDTDGDGDADHAALLDDAGRVLETAHLGPSGTWVPDGPGDPDPYGGTGAPVGAGTSGPGGLPGPDPGSGPDPDPGSGGGPGTPDGTGEPGGSGAPASAPITVEVGSHAVPEQATADINHDGTADTAVVRTPDGGTIAYTDSDGDGHADRAAVHDAQGRLVGTAHYDPASGRWTEDSGAGTATTLPGGAGGTAAGSSTAGAGPAGGIGDGAAGGGRADGGTGGVGASPAGTTRYGERTGTWASD